MTDKILAGQMKAYLRHEISCSDLAAWVDQALKENDMEQRFSRLLSELAVSMLETKKLSFEDCEKLLRKIGYEIRLDVRLGAKEWKEYSLRVAEKCCDFLREKYCVKRVILFGSLANGNFRPDSDIDLLVEGLPPHLFIKASAEVSDLVDDVEINLVPYERAYESLKTLALAEGKTLYG
ncbi:MAG: nucleotidyltransferase domain-containing protein [Candidatus Wallbacteria bacterium]|nr:nucleotidyltransferase domain-containing protein [Candidatus Wallbacteria bacterium]